MPAVLPQPAYGDGSIMRRISGTKGSIAFRGRLWKVPGAFRGQRPAIRPLDSQGHLGVFFASHHAATIDLTQSKSVSHVSEQPSTISPG